MVDAVNTPSVATPTPPPAASTSPSVSAPNPAPAPSPAPEATVAPAAAPAATIPEASVVETPEKPNTPLPAQAPEAPPVTPLGAPADDEPAEVPAEKPEGAEADAAKESAEGVKPEGDNKDPASQSDEPAPLPAFEAFKLPDGVLPDQEGFSNLNKMLGEFEVKTKASHEEVQALGQSLVDRHVEHLNDTIKKVSDAWTKNWENQKKDWFEKFKADPEIGGNRMDTTAKAARQFIRTHGGTADQQKEFRELMDQSGVGNHPAMIRMLAQASKAMSEGKPLPAAAPVAEKKGRAATLYGGR